MRSAILLTVLFLGIIGIVATILIFALKKTVGAGAVDESEDPTIKTAQEFLPFEDIREDVIVMGNHKYRAVLECSSVNYSLKTAGERDLIEMSFQQFLNSISFPITIFIQTKLIDNTERQAELVKNIEKTLEDFPQLASYANQYKMDMANLTNCIGNSLQKKRYIIVGYDDVDQFGELSEAEKVHYAAKEIRGRCNTVKAALDAVGVNSRMLNTRELVELVYSSYHRDDFSFAENIANGDAFSLFVDGAEDRFAERMPAATLDQILVESINKIEMEGLDEDEDGQAVLMTIKELRDRYAGFYKEVKYDV